MWNDLTTTQKSDLMQLFLRNGVSNLDEMKRMYDEASNSVDAYTNQYALGEQMITKKKPKVTPSENEKRWLQLYDQKWGGTEYDTPEWRNFWYNIAKIETGGTFNPNSLGPQTKYGRANGYFQIMDAYKTYKDDLGQFDNAKNMMQSNINFLNKKLTDSDKKLMQQKGITMYDLYAASWFSGAQGALDYLRSSKDSKDVTGTSISKYVSLARGNDGTPAISSTPQEVDATIAQTKTEPFETVVNDFSKVPDYVDQYFQNYPQPTAMPAEPKNFKQEMEKHEAMWKLEHPEEPDMKWLQDLIIMPYVQERQPLQTVEPILPNFKLFTKYLQPTINTFDTGGPKKKVTDNGNTHAYGEPLISMVNEYALGSSMNTPPDDTPIGNNSSIVQLNSEDRRKALEDIHNNSEENSMSNIEPLMGKILRSITTENTINDAKMIEGIKNGVIKGMNQSMADKAYKDAYDWVNSYYNSEGFNQRYSNLEKLGPEELDISVHPHDMPSGLQYSGYDDFDPYAPYTLKLYKPSQILVNNYQYENNSPDDILYSSLTYEPNYTDSYVNIPKYSYPIFDYNTLMYGITHELGHALSNSIALSLIQNKKENNMLDGRVLYSDLFPVFGRSKSMSKALATGNVSDWYDSHDEMFKTPRTFEIPFDEHDAKPDESYSDLVSLRRQLYDAGIFDSRIANQTFTKEMLKEFKEKVVRKDKNPGYKYRLLDNFSEDDVVWMINNIAMNDGINTFNRNFGSMNDKPNVSAYGGPFVREANMFKNGGQPEWSIDLPEVIVTGHRRQGVTPELVEQYLNNDAQYYPVEGPSQQILSPQELENIMQMSMLASSINNGLYQVGTDYQGITAPYINSTSRLYQDLKDSIGDVGLQVARSLAPMCVSSQVKRGYNNRR